MKKMGKKLVKKNLVLGMALFCGVHAHAMNSTSGGSNRLDQKKAYDRLQKNQDQSSKTIRVIPKSQFFSRSPHSLVKTVAQTSFDSPSGLSLGTENASRRQVHHERSNGGQVSTASSSSSPSSSSSTSSLRGNSNASRDLEYSLQSEGMDQICFHVLSQFIPESSMHALFSTSHAFDHCRNEMMKFPRSRIEKFINTHQNELQEYGLIGKNGELHRLRDVPVVLANDLMNSKLDLSRRVRAAKALIEMKVRSPVVKEALLVAAKLGMEADSAAVSQADRNQIKNLLPQVVDLLVGLYPADESVRHVVADGLNNSDGRFQIKAVQALSSIKIPAEDIYTVRKLVSFALDYNRPRADFAIKAIDKIQVNDPHLEDLLLTMIQNRQGKAGAAALILGGFGSLSDRAEKILLEAAKDEKFYGRDSAILALGKTGTRNVEVHKEIFKIMDLALESHNGVILEACVKALEDLKPSDPSIVSKLIEDSRAANYKDYQRKVSSHLLILVQAGNPSVQHHILNQILVDEGGFHYSNYAGEVIDEFLKNKPTDPTVLERLKFMRNRLGSYAPGGSDSERLNELVRKINEIIGDQSSQASGSNVR